jgi:hypothetical protein
MVFWRGDCGHPAGFLYLAIRSSKLEKKNTFQEGRTLCFPIVSTYNFNRREESTTDTEEAAIAADAIHGCKVTPSV